MIKLPFDKDGIVSSQAIWAVTSIGLVVPYCFLYYVFGFNFDFMFKSFIYTFNMILGYFCCLGIYYLFAQRLN